MGHKLRGSTGKCACSSCYMAVDPSAAFCDSCGNVFKGELEAVDCPSCGTLISVEASICPICNVKVNFITEEKNVILPSIQLGKEDGTFLMKLLSWRSNEPSATDTPEDIEEREQAMEVFRSIATLESDEIMEERVRDIEQTTKDKEEFEKLRKELLSLGKPFESILERNLMNINLIEKEIEEKNVELKRLKDEKGKDIEGTKSELERELEELQKKKQAMKSYESNILMLGGAFRRLLGQQQSELFRLESDLKKRVAAFQKEVEMRRKQKEKLRKREEGLDKREEELSHRFLDLKSRENELKVREEKLKNRLDELMTKEEELKTWEAEIEASRSFEAQLEQRKDRDKEFDKEEWLKEQKRLQADLFKMRDDAIVAGDNPQMNDEFKKMEDSLKEREEEMENLKNKLEELSTAIIEKDREIEKLKGGEPEFTMDEETRKLLKILDDLLEKLPEEVVDKFARSDDYLLYEKVLERFKI